MRKTALILSTAIFSSMIGFAAFADWGSFPLVQTGSDAGGPTYEPRYESDAANAFDPQPPWHEGDVVRVNGDHNRKVVCDNAGNCELTRRPSKAQRSTAGDLF